MFETVKSVWNKSTWSEKWVLIKQIAVEVAITLLAATLIFWFSMAVGSTIGLFVDVPPYHRVYTPSFHIRKIMPDNLVTVFINPNMKALACNEPPSDELFSELTMPYNEYCNIQQQSLPQMSSVVDITVTDINTSQMQYITGCIKHRGKDISCQKYPARERLLLFRQLDFYDLYYLQIFVQPRDTPQSRVDRMGMSMGMGIKVEFLEGCWLITRLIKDYSRVLMIGLCLFVSGMLALAAILWRIIRILGKDTSFNTYSQQPIFKVPSLPTQPKQLVRTSSVKISQSIRMVPEKDSGISRSSTGVDERASKTESMVKVDKKQELGQGKDSKMKEERMKKDN